MTNFELKFERGTDYDNKIELNIRLLIKPSVEDSKAILDSIDTLNGFANKYLKLTSPPIKTAPIDEDKA